MLYYTDSTNMKIKLEEESFCNLRDDNTWNVYYDHLKASEYIILKVLTWKGKRQSEVFDFATKIVQAISSL